MNWFEVPSVKKAKKKRRPQAPRPAPRSLEGVDLPAGQRVVCDYPPAACSPNRRDRWARIKAAKRYRATCFALALATKVKLPADGEIAVRLDIFPPDRSARDDDNAEAAFKAGRDGVAEALRVDDARFRVQRVMREEPLSCIVVTFLEEAEHG
jgi:hypothetical protein